MTYQHKIQTILSVLAIIAPQGNLCSPGYVCFEVTAEIAHDPHSWKNIRQSMTT